MADGPPPTADTSTAMDITSARSEESVMSKFLTIVSEGTMDKILLKLDKSRLAQVYAEVLPLKPEVVNKVHNTLTTIIKTQLSENIQAFIADEKLDQKFKELENLSNGSSGKAKTSGKAWRPTGVPPEQQVLAYHYAEKEIIRTELQKLVAEKTQRIAELKAKLATSRASAQESQVKCKELERRAATIYEECKSIAQ